MQTTLRKSRRNISLALLLIFGLLVAAAALGVVRVDAKGHLYGIFVLKGEDDSLIDIQDDLFLGDGSRLLGSVSLLPLHDLLQPSVAHACKETAPCLALEWDAKAGDGWVRSVDRDGSEMHFYFSRLRSDGGKEKHGLFVGGSLPRAAASQDPMELSDSGVSFHDGRRSWHIWCNANESISPARSPEEAVQPADWRFLGSRVLQQTPERVVLGSSHELLLDGEPVRIDRFAYFRAGERSFDLGIHIVNVGRRPVSYFYTYADEPWLGDFGTSEGTIGWTKAGLVSEEGLIDTWENQYAGMINLKYGLANFIAWSPASAPSLACFSNAIGRVAPASAHIPLQSNERAIGLQWGPRTLRPGEGQKILLTIGLAGLDPGAGLPRPGIAPAALLRH
jgi:hypothetical protein